MKIAIGNNVQMLDGTLSTHSIEIADGVQIRHLWIIEELLDT